MPDPRVNIIKPCPPSYLGKSASEIGQSTASRRNFTNAVGKVGDLEVLNSVGAGKVGQGLRTLASVSNSIRQGCGALPTSIGGALGSVVDGVESAFTSGTDWALQQMGMNLTTAQVVGSFNPGIANQALGQAQQLFNQVRQGNFKFTDIPNYLQDFQNLERLGRNIFTPGRRDRNTGLNRAARCEASPYAIDLIARAPKHKFMFVVEFIANPGYDVFGTSLLDMAFVVREATRFDVRYQMEDINFYNFRSKIITRTEFAPMTMQFYDDITNMAGRFHAALVKALSPVANYTTSEQFFEPETQGMDWFGSPQEPVLTLNGNSLEKAFNNTRYSASTGPLLNFNKTIFKEIRLFHLFDGARKMNVYSFYNPRFTDLKLDELTMAETNYTSVSVDFVYDSVFIATDVPFESLGKDNLGAAAQSAAEGIGKTALYPLRFIGSPAAATGPNNATGVQPGPPVTVTDCGPQSGTAISTGSTPPFNPAG